MNRKHFFAAAVAFALGFGGSALAQTSMKGSLRVGVAKLDVTPKDLTGLIGVSNRPFKGVREPIFVRALVLNDGTTTAAIVGIDFVEFGNTMALRQRIARELAIPADHIMIAPSHDHSAPRGGPPTPGTSSVTQGRPKTTPAYAQQTDDTIVEALRKAKASLQPARMGVGSGQADVNVYRYAYNFQEARWRAGLNPDGPSDKTVWVLKFESLSGEPIALMMNYAVHSNVMTGAGQKENEDMIWGDISGAAERYVEKHFQEKAVAIFTLGAAGDQYAKFNKEMDQAWAATPATELVDIQGRTLGMEVIQTASRIGQMTPVARIQAAERIVPCEMRATPQQQPGAKLDLHLGLIRINGTAITSVSGEVATDIYARLRKESPFSETIMATLVNDRVGYIPDEANWERMGAAFVRGCAENAIINNLVEMMKGTMP
jgi:neutral ceramidase